MSIDKTVNDASRACFYHLRALRHIRLAITASDANMIACSIAGSWLDYANAVLYGVSSKNTNRLQLIQNALARCVVDCTKITGVRMRCNNYTQAAYPSANWLQTCEAGVPRSLFRHQFVPELISCPISAIPYALLSIYLPARCSQDKDSLRFARVSRRRSYRF
jgi:hypothetical protein